VFVVGRPSTRFQTRLRVSDIGYFARRNLAAFSYRKFYCSSGIPEVPAKHQSRVKMAVPMSTSPSKNLETFPNPNPDRDYEIHFECPEFTCLCPMTGQPDFATILVDYVPDQRCVELKSLKLYLWSYRDEGAFHEAVTNRIFDDLRHALSPRRLTVTGQFLVRGGITTTIRVGTGT
jgi:7-cyano-7-deazaguanine reductase